MRIQPLDKTNFARNLRKNQTDAERNLWYYLRNRRLNGIKFKRQQLIGPYIVDFVSIQEKLIIELDGSQHSEKIAAKYDTARTNYLQKNGYKVLRFWDTDVLTNMEGVFHIILANLPSS